MQREAENGSRSFLLRWVLGTGAGWFGGFMLGFIVASGFEPLVGMGPWQGVLAYFILGAFLGATVGFAQWLVLRKRVSGTGSWVAAGAAGMGIAGGSGYGTAVLIFGYSEGLEDLGSLPGVLGWTVVVAIGGAVIGGLQWRALRGRVARAGWWVLASTMAWGLSIAAAGAVMTTAYQLLDGRPAALWFLGGLAVGGATFGAVSGIAITRLLLQRRTEAPPSGQSGAFG